MLKILAVKDYMSLRVAFKFILLLLLTTVGLNLGNRNIQHLLCALVIVEYMNVMEHIGLKLNNYIYYGLYCISWELKQFISRGYFQFDQFICDMIGIGLSYIIFKKILAKKKVC